MPPLKLGSLKTCCQTHAHLLEVFQGSTCKKVRVAELDTGRSYPKRGHNGDQRSRKLKQEGWGLQSPQTVIGHMLQPRKGNSMGPQAIPSEGVRSVPLRANIPSNYGMGTSTLRPDLGWSSHYPPHV